MENMTAPCKLQGLIHPYQQLINPYQQNLAIILPNARPSIVLLTIPAPFIFKPPSEL